MTTLSKKEQCKELARLMREGAAKTLPSRDAFYARSKYHEYTCALGAVLYAKNQLNSSSKIDLLQEIFPILEDDLIWEIIRKNYLETPREEIANWLESLEWDD